MNFLLIALLTLLNGVFAMSELALASSRKARLTAMADNGDKGAKASLKLLEDPTQFLSSVQVGITSIGMLNGIIGEAAFSEDLARVLMRYGVPEGAAGFSATAIVVTAITFITIVLGELVPKRIGQLYPEAVSRWIARPMTWVAIIAKPFVRLLTLSTQGMLKLLRIDNNAAGRAVTEEEIAASLAEGRDAGVIEAHEHQMVENVFRLDDRPLTSLMVPRADVQWFDAGITVEQALQQVAAAENGAHSWYPVCRGSLDDVVGVINVARLLQLDVKEPQSSVAPHSEAASFIPETLSGMEVLEQFRTKTGRMVFVVDEYGDVQGLLTPRDLLEAITGELHPETQLEAWATRREDGSWLLDGLMPVGELKNRLDIKHLPEEDRGRYNTLAGLLLSVYGYLPVAGERIECAGWVFEVVDLDGKRIDTVLATVEPDSALAPQSE